MMSDCGCDCGCNDVQSKEQESNLLECPTCGEEGKGVPFDVIKTFINKDLRRDITNGEFYICLNSKCKTAYYNKNGDYLFSINGIQKPIWFKEGSKPKIACYCNDITYEQVKKAVNQYDLRSWKEIVLHYNEKIICKCSKLNPTGECCSDNFNKVIDRF
ncbi:hypothetical protein [Selenihalanaerobacter shriftii]|nr:hypothetical protein [Selenihalanaerobacter shriftii]